MPSPMMPARMDSKLENLAGAHAVAHVVNDRRASVVFGDSTCTVTLVDSPAVLRQLLTDALAQLDAAGAQQ